MASMEPSAMPNLPRIGLPRPRHGRRGISSYEALEHWRTTRQISSAPISLQTLSDLLRAACSVNRTDGPFGATGRIAASASNSLEIDVYVAMWDAVYRYEPLDLELVPVAYGDLRGYAMTPGQLEANADVPVQLIYIADTHRLTHTAGFQEPGLHDAQPQKCHYCASAGIIAANVYLYCAGEGLAAWFHDCDPTALALGLGLREDQRVLFAQSVGYPENV